MTVDDLGDESEGTGTNTPAGEPSDDFFSSWDKPAIKTPSNPPSRSSTPGIKRTASPFLSANQNGATSRPKSPLVVSEASDAPEPAPASRAVASAAVKKTATTTKPKANILGAKKTKLGAKKVDSSAVDFDEAEKKAREEAERIERLGYNPDEPTPSENKFVAAQPETSGSTTIHQPTPLSPGRAGSFGSTTAGQARQRSDSEMERLGMGVRRLGFGQVGSAASPTKAATTSKGMGFGAVSKAPVVGKTHPPSNNAHPSSLTLTTPPHTQAHPSNTPFQHLDDSERYARDKFGTQKGISSDEFFGRAAFSPTEQSEARTRLQGFEGATSISSNAYFGRPEEDYDAEMNLDQYNDLESAAKDFVRRFGITAGDDIENLTNILGEGAVRLQGAIRSYLNS